MRLPPWPRCIIPDTQQHSHTYEGTRAPDTPLDMDQARFSSILDEARIYSLPPSAFYIPDFITRTEEQMLLEKVGLQHAKYFVHASALEYLRRLIDTWRSLLLRNHGGDNSRTGDCRLGHLTSSTTPSLTHRFRPGSRSPWFPDSCPSHRPIVSQTSLPRAPTDGPIMFLSMSTKPALGSPHTR